jgi:hypothetical protein
MIDRPTQPMALSPEVQKIVAAYISQLLSRKSSPLDASELPYPKATIKLALIAAITVTEDSKMREQMRSAFVQLADWQEGIGPGPHSMVDLFGGNDLVEEAKRISAAGPAIMKIGAQVIAEMQALLDELKSLGM